MAASVQISRRARQVRTTPKCGHRSARSGGLFRARGLWLRGEPKHCSMAAIPTLEDEDARRPGRERESLVKEGTRIVNRVKANLARLGIRGFRPTLARASEQLKTLRTPEGAVVPQNTLAELQRDMAHLRFVKQQIMYGKICVKADFEPFPSPCSTCRRPSPRPDLVVIGRCAQRPSRVAEGHREATCP
jgi:hypothetical protein